MHTAHCDLKFSEQNLLFFGITHHWLKYGVHSIWLLLKVSILSPQLSQLLPVVSVFDNQQNICVNNSDNVRSNYIIRNECGVRLNGALSIDFHCQQIKQMGETDQFLSSDESVRSP